MSEQTNGLPKYFKSTYAFQGYSTSKEFYKSYHTRGIFKAGGISVCMFVFKYKTLSTRAFLMRQKMSH